MGPTYSDIRPWKEKKNPKPQKYNYNPRPDRAFVRKDYDVR